MKSERKRFFYTVAVTLIVVYSATFSVLMTLERMDYRNYLQGEYSKNMYELVDSVDNIKADLGKAAISGSREQKIIVFEDIFRYSAIANDKLNSLPIEQSAVSATSKYLSQVGDFCYSLVRASAEGRELTDKDYATINILDSQSNKLLTELNGVLTDINVGKVSWGEIRKKVTGVFAKGGNDVIGSQFTDIQKQIAQYPSLIYDGPFSENVMNIAPKINSQKMINQSQATAIIQKMFGKNNIKKIEVAGVNPKGSSSVNSYDYNIVLNGSSKNRVVTCSISKYGGKIVYLIDNRNIGSSSMDIKKAISLGSNFLSNLGYKNMESTYALNYGNIAVISYIYRQNNVFIYPDQIKLKVALDNGQIVGIESDKYLVSHIDRRNIPAPQISAAQAKSKVSKRLKINSVRLAIIPTESNQEVLCYEYEGSYNNNNYIVYINSQTGYEQKILQIINTPNGQLTM